MKERRHCCLYFRLYFCQCFAFLHSKVFTCIHGPDLLYDCPGKDNVLDAVTRSFASPSPALSKWGVLSVPCMFTEHPIGTRH